MAGQGRSGTQTHHQVAADMMRLLQIGSVCSGAVFPLCGSCVEVEQRRGEDACKQLEQQVRAYEGALQRLGELQDSMGHLPDAAEAF